MNNTRLFIFASVVALFLLAVVVMLWNLTLKVNESCRVVYVEKPVQASPSATMAPVSPTLSPKVVLPQRKAIVK